jgi:hypothetical protein
MRDEYYRSAKVIFWVVIERPVDGLKLGETYPVIAIAGDQFLIPDEVGLIQRVFPSKTSLA